MVVSCQVKIIVIFTFLYMACMPVFSFADTPQLITDAELDTIVASNLPNNITEALTNELLDKILNNSIGSILDSGLLSSGLTQVNATDSTVVVQTNIAFFINVTAGDVHQSNTAFISN